MASIFSQLKRYDWILMGAVLFLIAVGILTLFSLSGVTPFPFFQRQILWSAIGLFILFAASRVDFRIFRTQSAAVFLFYLSIVALLALVLAGHVSIRGVSSWFRFGSVLVQPVELAKLSLIILFAKFFSKRHVEIYRIDHLLVSGVYLAIPTGLVLLQPDLGSVIVLIAIWLVTVVFSGMRLRHLLLLLFFGAAASLLAWSFALAPYQKDRITSFINPALDPQGAGYQMIQSTIAVGSGRIWGKGLGYGSQTHLHFLPEAETDFIFAAYAEEWGFVGVLILLAVLFVAIWRIIRIGAIASDSFSRLYALGFGALVAVQSFIHIGMNMGALPITGITLPFVSYGGSSLITLLLGIGILQNIKINARREVE